MSLIDILVIALYLIGITVIGLWVVRKKSMNSDGYFLAGRSLKWPVIGAALFASNISTIHLVGLAASGFSDGLVWGNFEWMAIIILIILALIFAPFYYKNKIATLPEFMEIRYNATARTCLAILGLLGALFMHIGVSLYAGAVVLEHFFGVNVYVSILVISLITAIYTVVGGLQSVVITESIQTVILLGGAIILTIYGIMALPDHGIHSLEDLKRAAKPEQLSIIPSSSNSSGLTWSSILLGYPVLGIWYWCADQTIVQRVLGAKDENHARVGPLFCGFIKILPVFIFVLPGLFAYTLAQSGKLDISLLKSIDATGKEVVNSKGIYTLMITQLLPTGLIGILVAALLSGLMSQVSGALNSISTMAGYDIYKRYRPDASDKQLVKVGKIAAGIALVFSLGLLPLLNRYESIFNGLNDIIAHIAPPITCVFLLGVFWKKASATSAKITLWAGSALGAIVFAVNKIFVDTSFAHIPFMMMAFYLFCACFIMQICLSYAYPVKHNSQSEVLYWKSWREPLQSPGWKGLGNYKTLSVILLLLMGVLFWVFR